jgi:NAD+ kinase
MKKTIRTVGLFGKYRDPSVREPLERLARFLLGRGLALRLDDHTARLLPEGLAPVSPIERIGGEIDLAIVIGGDGTLLSIARHLAPFNVPVVGVNQGRLGFLTEIPVEQMTDELARILDGDHQIERRLLLSAEIMRRGKIAHSASAFNDVIVTKGELARMIEFETFINGEFVNSTRGDGIIIASPTGSTAYAMSAGGPILHPTLPAIALVPICPHTLSYRPIVVGSDSVIEIVMSGAPDQLAHISFDGQASERLEDGDRIYVRRAAAAVELIHPAHRSYFQVLRAKLGWGEKY